MASTTRTSSSRSRRGHTRRASSTTALSAAALLFATTPLASAHSFPYVPTQVLLAGPACADSMTPCEGSDLAYIFRQTDAGAVEFLSLNFSSSISQDLDLESPTGDKLPFLDGESDTTAFGAARTPNGTLLVYAGDCETGDGNVWSYTAQDDGWVKRGLGDSGDGTRAPYFLGGTVAFSSTLAPEMDQPTIYTYGGMCSSPTDNETEWQGAANYTKSMLSLAPKKEEADTPYTLSVASSAGPRTPIAGFTLTGLTPSMTNKSGIVTQQASWVLLGGHSQTAFINMSTAAVWNLPAESWTYVNIQAPDESQRSTDLAVKAKSSNEKTASRRATTVEDVYSRSGHTATLSEDGLSIVVLGGWVGDVETPAEPQLAILEMSEAYSGWQWSIPAKQPEVDLYGHGSAVLPGNVMMVYGGWEISSSSSKNKRQESTSPRFLNLTSMTWTSSYENPDADREDTDDGNAPKEGGKPNAKRLGLGLGLGFGLAALIAVAGLVSFCCFKKHKRRRENREKAVRALSQDASHFLPDHDEMLERDDDPWSTGGWYTGQDPYSAGERSLGYESLRPQRSVSFAGPLPGLHIPRKPVVKQLRGGYVQTATRPASFVATPGRIHPIYEDDEEESYHQAFKEEVHTPTSDAPSDPFQTPTHNNNVPPPLFASGGRGSATPSPEGPRHDPEVQDWVSDVDAADAMLARMNSRGPQGRGSPTRRGSYRAVSLRDDESRSGSNLSESTRSTTDSLKQSSIGRRLSTLSPLLMGGGVEHPKPGSSSSSSYNTARSSFGALQAEGPSLLMGRGTGGGYDEDDPPQPSSPSKSKPRRGWLGSLRRVFSNSSTPTSSREDMSQVRRSFDQEPVGGDYEPGLVGLHGELLRRKQGRQGWEEGGEGPLGTGTVRSAEPSPESDWDIERAVEQRLVQVMFTVPRERLRVVNGDADGSDEEILVQPQSAVLVDPEKERRRSTDAGSTREKVLGRDGELRVKDDEKMDEKPDQVLYEKTEAPSDESPPYDEKEFHREEQQDLPRSPPPLHLQPVRPLFHHQPPSPSPSPPLETNTHSHARNLSSDTAHTVPYMHHLDLAPLETRFSHETDDSMGRRSSGIVMEAEAVPLTRERARTTRVLQMVDSFETLSRDGSREGSPTRDKN